MTASQKGCCSPARGTGAEHSLVPVNDGSGSYIGPVADIPGGIALIGTAQPQIPDDGETSR
jgi:hypothetical protein